jgi:hypothetical protein
VHEDVEAGPRDRPGGERTVKGMSPPRATLTMNAVGFMMANWASPIIPVVSGVFGMWMVTKSDCASSSSSGRSVTPSCWARVAVT